MILNFCRIIQFGDPNAVSVQIAQKQGPCLEVTLDQEKENLIRAKTVLSGMWEDWAFGLRRNDVD